MSVKCNILLVLLNLFSIVYTNDWTTNQIVANKDPARQSRAKVEIGFIKKKLKRISTRLNILYPPLYHKISPAKKQEKPKTSNEITTVENEQKYTKILTRTTKITARSEEITTLNNKEKTTPDSTKNDVFHSTQLEGTLDPKESPIEYSGETGEIDTENKITTNGKKISTDTLEITSKSKEETAAKEEKKASTLHLKESPIEYYDDASEVDPKNKITTNGNKISTDPPEIISKSKEETAAEEEEKDTLDSKKSPVEYSSETGEIDTKKKITTDGKKTSSDPLKITSESKEETAAKEEEKASTLDLNDSPTEYYDDTANEKKISSAPKEITSISKEKVEKGKSTTKEGEKASTVDLNETPTEYYDDTSEINTENKMTTNEEKISSDLNEITSKSKEKMEERITTTKEKEIASTVDLNETPTEYYDDTSENISKNKMTTNGEKLSSALNEITSKSKENMEELITTTKGEEKAITLDLPESPIEYDDTTEIHTKNNITTNGKEISSDSLETISKSKEETATKEKEKASTLDLNEVPKEYDDVSEIKTTKEITTNGKKISSVPLEIHSKSKEKIDKLKTTHSTKGEKYTQTIKGRKKKIVSLNPYDLKNDLLKVMNYFPNANTSVEVIGRTVEYKDIVLLKITDANINDKKVGRQDDNKLEENEKEENSNKINTENEDIAENENIGTEINNKVEKENNTVGIEIDGKKIIFIVHGLSTLDLWKIPCFYEEKQFKILISYYLSHLKNFDIFLIPVANPDGYARKDNLWNKNVSPQEDCGGVALDRNFDITWESRSNVTSCDQSYPGPTPFSEAESDAIKDVFLRYGKRMAAYIHVHATDDNYDFRGNTVLIPKGYTDEESDEDKYLDLKGEIDEAMKEVFDIVSVNLKTLYNWYGPVAGTSVDYAAEVIEVPFAMEFLVQPYEIKEGKDLNRSALTHIWRRVINTVFTFIHKIDNSDESD